MNAANFKWMMYRLLSITPLCFSQAAVAKVIYGMENTAQYHSSDQGPFYIQAGAFHSKHLAHTLRDKIAATTDYEVHLNYAKGFYAVVIGPLPSVQAVQAIGGINAPHIVARNAPMQREPIQREQITSKAIYAPSTSNETTKNWYIASDVGLLQTTENHALTVANNSGFQSPQNVDQYSQNHHEPVMWDVKLGRQWTREESWLPRGSLALRYQYLFPSNMNGTVTQYSLPTYKNYYYTWGVSSNVLSGYAKLALIHKSRFLPYVDAGVGGSFNQAQHYQEQAVGDVTPRVSPGFRSQSNTALTYNVGAGIDFEITNQWLLTLGYDYQSFGSINSGNGQGTWASQKLSLGNYASNMGLIGLTYLLDDHFYEN